MTPPLANEVQILPFQSYIAGYLANLVNTLPQTCTEIYRRLPGYSGRRATNHPCPEQLCVHVHHHAAGWDGGHISRQVRTRIFYLLVPKLTYTLVKIKPQ